MQALLPLKKHPLTWILISLAGITAMMHTLAFANYLPVHQPSAVKGKRVAIVIPFVRYNLFLHQELTNAFNSTGLNVTVVSSRIGKAMPNRGSDPVMVKKTVDQLQITDFDALLFVGGGSLYSEFSGNTKTLELIRDAAESGKVIGGLDLGKALLVKAGIMNYSLPDNRDSIGGAVTVKDKIVTGNSAYVIQSFITAFTKILGQEQAAQFK